MPAAGHFSVCPASSVAAAPCSSARARLGTGVTSSSSSPSSSSLSSSPSSPSAGGMRERLGERICRPLCTVSCRPSPSVGPAPSTCCSSSATSRALVAGEPPTPCRSSLAATTSSARACANASFSEQGMSRRWLGTALDASRPRCSRSSSGLTILRRRTRYSFLRIHSHSSSARFLASRQPRMQYVSLSAVRERSRGVISYVRTGRPRPRLTTSPSGTPPPPQSSRSNSVTLHGPKLTLRWTPLFLPGFLAIPRLALIELRSSPSLSRRFCVFIALGCLSQS
mmetsp:Transcript_38509/g.89088  ORF Transcript_38509/g.89088 Transcript_38509/m.89088 type:complete len:282 (-) Transcript_38509:117-962(-)